MHVTRQRARVAAVLFAFCMIAYTLVPTTFRWDDPVRQFFLVLASVAAGAVFLPEISSDLWNLNGDQVRKLIPDERRRALARALIDADSRDPRWAELVHTQGLNPLLDAGRLSGQVVYTMNYSVQVHVHQQVTIEGRSWEVHTVETSVTAERSLPQVPDNGFLWISVARTENALAGEFGAVGCLARELVCLDGLDGRPWWEAMTQERLCAVSVMVNGQVQEVSIQEFDESAPDIARWCFRPDLGGSDSTVPVRITFDFPLRVDERRFPVMFSGYYCAGATVISIKLYSRKEVDLHCDAFFGRGLGERRGGEAINTTAGLICQEMSFTTGRDSILWPGSGLVFSWTPSELKAPTAAIPAPLSQKG